MRLPVVGAAYSHGRTEVTARVAKNLWFETRPDGEKAPVLCTHLPKKTNYSMSEAITSPVSIVSTDAGFTYIASTTKLYGFAPGSGIVTFGNTFPSALTAGARLEYASDQTNIVMTQVNNASYCSVGGGTINAITIPDSQVPVSVAWLRGYFVMLTLAGRLYFSTDGSTWNALAFATAEASPDGGSAIRAVGNVLVVFGSRTIEFWAPSGNADIPFTPITEAVVRMGLSSANALCMIGGQVYFWGSPQNGPRGLFTLDGQHPQRLSTPDLEKVIGSSAFNPPWVSGFELFGHKIVTLTPVPGSDTYWFDLSTGAVTHIPSGAPFNGKCEFITDYADIYGVNPAEHTRHFKLDASTYDTDVVRELVTDNVSTPDLDRFTVDKVRLDVAVDSAVSLAVSRDGGWSWGSSRSSDASGTRGVRGIVQFDRYGTAPQFTFKVGATGKFVLSNIIINPRN